MNQFPKIPGTSSPFQTYKFIKNPITFLNNCKNKYGSTYWFKLGGQKLYVTSNQKIAQEVLTSKHTLFEPEPIIDVLGINLLTENNNIHLKNKKIFVMTISEHIKFLESIIDHYLEKFKFRHAFYKLSENIIGNVNDLIIEILTRWFVGTSYKYSYDYSKLNKILKEFFKLLTSNFLFSKMARKFSFIKWKKFLKIKQQLLDELDLIRSIDSSILSSFMKNGFSKTEAIDQSLLFLFASFDNISITIYNLLIKYYNEFKNATTQIQQDTVIDECLKQNPPVLILPTTLKESLEFELIENTIIQNYKFPTGTNISVDLYNTNISAFGFGTKKCPAELWSKIIIRKITNDLCRNICKPNKVKYGRIRFSWGPTILKL